MSDCTIPLKRVRYFSGQLLSQDDLETEQEYFRDRMRRHNQLLHGYGVATGLKVRLADDPPGQVVVTPGFAVDALGNELVVSQPCPVALPEDGDEVWLVLRYAERETDPVPAGTATDGTDGTQCSRIEETIELAWAESLGDELGVPLARLRRKKKGWKVSRGT